MSNDRMQGRNAVSEVSNGCEKRKETGFSGFFDGLSWNRSRFKRTVVYSALFMSAFCISNTVFAEDNCQDSRTCDYEHEKTQAVTDKYIHIKEDVKLTNAPLNFGVSGYANGETREFRNNSWIVSGSSDSDLGPVVGAHLQSNGPIDWKISDNSFKIDGNITSRLMYGIQINHNDELNASVSNTTLEIANGTYNAVVAVAFTGASKKASVDNTHLIISGGKFDSSAQIVGVLAPNPDTAEVTNTSVSLTGKPDLNGAILFSTTADNYRNSTLTVALEHSTNLAEAQRFSSFDLRATTILDKPALTVGQLDLAGATVSVSPQFSQDELPTLQSGDKTYILASENGLNTDNAHFTNIDLKTSQESLGAVYNFDVLAEDNQIGVEFVDSKANPKAESFSQVPLASLGLLAQAANMLEYVRAAPVFGTVRMEKGEFDDENLELHGTHFIFGGGRNFKNDSDEVLVAGFIEAGEGDYEATGRFENTPIRAEGDRRYAGGGLLVRQTMTGGDWKGFYWEGALRIGKIDSDYSSTFTDSLGNRARFDMDNLYYGAQLNVGYEWKLSERSSLTPYVKGLWTHLEGDSVDLYGEKLQYGDTDMFRLRAGGTYACQVNENVALTLGLGYDHIFNSEQNMKIDNRVLDSGNIDGGSAMLELGVKLTPPDTKNLEIEVMARGFKGNYDAIAGIVNVSYRF